MSDAGLARRRDRGVVNSDVHAEAAWGPRIARGDQGAFAEAHSAYAEALVAYAQHVGVNRADAEDVVQDVFVALWRRRITIAGTPSLRAWLFHAVRCRALNARRDAARRDAIQGALTHSVMDHGRDDPSPRHHDAAAEVPEDLDAWTIRDARDEALTSRELEAVIARAESELPDRCRQVYLLSRECGLTHAEIASVLEISAKAVEGHMARALRTFRAALMAWRRR